MGTVYYPYLRGRQFELLAIRELVEQKKIAEHVVPIIEPLKLNATLAKTLEQLAVADKKFAIVRNPEYGYFLQQLIMSDQGDGAAEKVRDALQRPECIMAQLMSASADTDTMLYDMRDHEHMAINTKRDDMKQFNSLLETIGAPDYTLIPDDRAFRRKVTKGKILFQDHFRAAKRNVDYIDRQDEFFTDDHLYAADEGYSGMADYSIVGSAYNTAGFAPVAVAIHIVYPREDLTLYVRHFVSDSNEGIEDPGGKFGEAVTHLAEWYDSKYPKAYDTQGLRALLQCQAEKKFPGLGTVKKFSIMHHLELMERILGE